MRQGAGHCPQAQHQKCTKAQNVKPQQRGPVGHRVPPPEEEDPRVKCKDCGAFGHTARSTRCPVKCWDGALAPRPMCPNKGKENHKPWKPQNLQKPGAFIQAEGQKEQRNRSEEQQRKALLQNISGGTHGRQQHNWKDVTESCDYPRCPTRPMPVHTTRKISVLAPDPASQPPVKKTDVRPTCPAMPPTNRPEHVYTSFPGQNKVQEVAVPGTYQSTLMHYGQSPALLVKPTDQNPQGGSFKVPLAAFRSQGVGQVLHSLAPPKGPGVSKEPCLQPAAHTKGYGSSVSVRAPGKRPAQVSIQTCQIPPKKPRHSPLQIPLGNTPRPDLGTLQNVQPLQGTSGPRPKESPQITRKTPAQVPSIDATPPGARPHLSTIQSCTQAHSPPFSSAPRQPLRMVLRRLHNDWWSSQVLTAPPSHPPENPHPPATDPPLLKKSEGHGSQVPLSVLYEDLQVSSSSEESDRE